MEEINNQRIRTFLEVARKLLTCTLCTCRVTEKVCYCSKGHSVCYKCAVRKHNIFCPICKNLVIFKKCVILNQFAECLLLAEKQYSIKSLEEILECTVCYDPIISGFKLCFIGHIVCYNCWIRLAMCPICNRKFSLLTNKLLVDLINAFPYHCNFSEKGCKTIGCRKDILKHEIMCKYREFSCQVRSCIWKGASVKVLAQHLRSMHPEVPSSSNSVKLVVSVSKLNTPQYRTHFVNVNGKYFWQHFYCIQGRVHFFTLMLGSPEEAKEYKVTVSGNSLTKTCDVITDDCLNIDNWFDNQRPVPYNITKLITQKVLKGKTGELIVTNECKVSIEKIKPCLKTMNFVALTVLGGFVIYLLF